MPAHGPPLQRHRLVRLSDAGWRRVCGHDWDPQARECVDHWAAQRLPLVVTRQPSGLPAGAIAVGLAAPVRWGRRRLALQVAMADVLYFDEFPHLDAVRGQLPEAARAAARRLEAALDAAGVTARVCGSHGWERLTGLGYLHRDSDLDLLLAVARPARADAVLDALHAFEADVQRPRLDGELLFDGGTACAWREWQAWREGRSAQVLTKSIGGPALAGTPGAFMGEA